APGVWATALPFPSPLRYSLSYIVDTPGGTILVDAGWDSDAGWDKFLAGLANAGKAIDDVRGLVVTHAHADHFGLAARLRTVSDAWIALHPAERPQIVENEAATMRRFEDMYEWMQRCGAPPMQLEALRNDLDEVSRRFPVVAPDIDLVASAPIPDTQGQLVAVHTAGHTPGSVCFLDRERGLLFTGDHFLPRVSPNVSKRPTSDVDPLRDYLSSLATVDEIDAQAPVTALPGHEWAFGAVGRRVSELRTHHEARLDEIAHAVLDGRSTVWEVAQAVRWSRPFTELSTLALRSAIGETYAHLYRLEAAGRIRPVREEAERAARWRRT
ncbi:MBL fold metallo-hydrolase, partial [Mycobacterium sp.]|uniref:MBL fold metallo-hydrolase n=1 Tax=Mycobacterium sp. TaxID=1785 RepID=UPI003BAFB33B